MASPKLKIQKTTVVDQVYNALKQQIRDDEYKIGDKLPSESDLAAFFEVNRLTVRMALQKLSAVGMVETKVGDGTYVLRPSLIPLLNEIQDFYDSPDNLNDVTALRKVLEVESIRIACENATEEELASLKKCIDNYDHYMGLLEFDVENKELLDKTVDADLAIHKYIIAMSHNQLFQDVFSMLERLIRNNIKNLLYNFVKKTTNFGNEKEKKEAFGRHTALYEAISRGDVEEAINTQRVIINPTIGDKRILDL